MRKFSFPRTQTELQFSAPKITAFLTQNLDKVSLLLHEFLRKHGAVPSNYWHLESA
jgi:hypothetical protein